MLTQMVIELEAKTQIGADKYEQTPKRSNHRNAWRKSNWETGLGEIELRIPKLRKGSFYLSLFDPRRRSYLDRQGLRLSHVPEGLGHLSGFAALDVAIGTALGYNRRPGVVPGGDGPG